MEDGIFDDPEQPFDGDHNTPFLIEVSNKYICPSVIFNYTLKNLCNLSITKSNDKDYNNLTI